MGRGADFLELWNRSDIRFHRGRTNQTLTITILGDDRPEPDETIVLRFDRGFRWYGAPVIVPTDNEVVVTIVDDD